MTVAGLRFRNEAYSDTPSVTKNGIFVYDTNPADYHELEFRTELQVVAYEQQKKRRKKKEKKNKAYTSFESSGGPEQGRADRSPQTEASVPAMEERFLGSVPPASTTARPAAPPSRVTQKSRWMSRYRSSGYGRYQRGCASEGERHWDCQVAQIKALVFFAGRALLV